jgi:hypothetical protein
VCSAVDPMNLLAFESEEKVHDLVGKCLGPSAE